jgi:hypothetical protein
VSQIERSRAELGVVVAHERELTGDVHPELGIRRGSQSPGWPLRSEADFGGVVRTGFTVIVSLA